MSILTGRALRIDLGRRSAAVEDVPADSYRRFLSARGLGAKFLYDELAPGLDPLGPENKLIFLIGALGGTGMQGFSKWAAMSKSPLTGSIFRSFAGGDFGVWMKYAGYDLIIIEGRADQPAYVHVDESGVRFLDARDLWGLDHRRLQEALKRSHGPRTASACIGPAGEKGVRYAVITSGERTASRGGMGTVMGSKNLKAVSIDTMAASPRPVRPEQFKDLIRRQVGILRDHPRRKNMNTLGTPYITTVVDGLGILPVKNFQEGRLADIEKIAGEEFLKLKKAKTGCFGCMTRCGGLRDVRRGPFGGSEIDGPEYESIYSFGPLLGISDPQFVVDANALCDYHGLDAISTGVCLAFAFELFEKGIFSAGDLDGIEPLWGDVDAAFALIDRIGRREGAGELLGEGVKIAAESIGRGAGPMAMHIKGLELPGYDPRGVKGYALSMAVSNIGGSHMYGRPRDELSGKVDPYTETNKGAAVAEVQKEQAVEDSLVACTFSNTGLDMSFYAEAVAAGTGIEGFDGPDEMLRIGERIMCLERLFNVREGFTRVDDALPERLTSEPLKNAGPAEGCVVENLDGLLDEYYKALGYDSNGIPEPGKIRNLGLDEAEDQE